MFVPRIIVRFMPGEVSDFVGIVLACGGLPGKYISAPRVMTVYVPEGVDKEDLRQRLHDRPEVRHAYYEPEMEFRGAYNTGSNDPLIASFGGGDVNGTAFRRANVLHAWKHTTGSQAVTVGIIDSGICGHRDLPAPEVEGVEGAWDKWAGAAGYSHGTNCWSVIKAIRDNGVDTAGVCPDSRGMFVVNDGNEEGDGVYPESLAAIYWAADNGAKILSLSWGWYDNAGVAHLPAYQDMTDACSYAWAHGVLIFVAEGNYKFDHDVWLSIPNHSGPGQIVNVGAIAVRPGDYPDNPNFGNPTDPALVRVSGQFGSDYGSDMALACPSFIPMANNGGNIYGGGGSSFASPFAAGCAALAWSINPALTNQQIRDIITSTASPSRWPQFATYFPQAFGVVNAGKAVAKARATLPANAGVPIPYLGFLADDTREMTVIDGAGVPTTSLSGVIDIDVSGFCDEGVAYVELRHGSRCVYRGPPTILRTTATAGTGDVLTVKAVAANGASAEETYTDINVSALALATVPDVAYPTDTTWEVLVPASGAAGTYEAVASTGETASVEVPAEPLATGPHVLRARSFAQGLASIAAVVTVTVVTAMTGTGASPSSAQVQASAGKSVAAVASSPSTARANVGAGIRSAVRSESASAGSATVTAFGSSARVTGASSTAGAAAAAVQPGASVSGSSASSGAASVEVTADSVAWHVLRGVAYANASTSAPASASVRLVQLQASIEGQSDSSASARATLAAGLGASGASSSAGDAGVEVTTRAPLFAYVTGGSESASAGSVALHPGAAVTGEGASESWASYGPEPAGPLPAGPVLVLAFSAADPYVGRISDADPFDVAVTDAARCVAAFSEAPFPESTPGAVLVAAGRIPMLTTTGTPATAFPAPPPWGLAGATIERGVLSLGPCAVLSEDPPRPVRATVQLVDLDGAPVDLAGWAFDARLYSQRGGLLASGLTAIVDAGAIVVALPEPATLALTPAVLRITCETAGATLALGYPTTAVELLLIAQEA